MSEFKFNSYFIKNLLTNSEKNTLTAYHYTSPNAFHSIISEGCVRFSDIRFMNDKSEMVYAVKVLLEFLDEYPGEYLFFREVLGTLIDESKYSDIKELKITNVDFNDLGIFKSLLKRSFLFCLTNEKDSLNMWNYYVYGGRYEGFNVGFDLYKLIQTFDTHSAKEVDGFHVYYGNVVYKKEKQFDVIHSIVEEIETMKNHELSPIVPFAACRLRSEIESKGLFIKNPGFSSENEYRIVVSIEENRIPHSTKEAQKYFGENNKLIVEDFCVKNGMIVPFLKIKIPEDAVEKITISPTAEFDIASKGVQEFLKTKGFIKAEVVPSKMPVRF